MGRRRKTERAACLPFAVTFGIRAQNSSLGRITAWRSKQKPLFYPGRIRGQRKFRRLSLSPPANVNDLIAGRVAEASEQGQAKWPAKRPSGRRTMVQARPGAPLVREIRTGLRSVRSVMSVRRA